MSAEAKVGAFAVGGLMALGSAVYAVGDFNIVGGDDLTVYAGFPQVLGLETQSAVRLRGVPVGNVAEIKNDGSGVTVTLRVKPDTKIPKDSRVTVSSSGVMGEKFVNIMPGRDDGDYLQDGDYVYGVEEADMNAMFDGMNKVLGKVDDLLGDVQNIVGNETFQTSVITMSKNMEEASGNVNQFTSSLAKMSNDNAGKVSQMADHMNEILSSLDRSMATVENMTQNINRFAGNPQTAEDLQTTLKNISDTSKNVANMAENMNKFAGDPKVAEDMKATVHNAKNITERADKILEKVQGASESFSKIEVTPSVEVLYGKHNHKSDWNTNFNLDIASGDTSLRLGAEDIGDHTRLNAQVGKKFGENFGARGGIIAGKPGIALDAYAGKNVKFSAEVYDPNEAKLRLKSQFKIADSTYLLGEWHDVTHKDNRAAYFGIKREF